MNDAKFAPTHIDKDSYRKDRICICNFCFILLKWVLILHHSEQIRTRSHLTTFYVPSSLVQSWAGWLLSGGMGENLGIAIPVPPLERGGQVGTEGQASCAVAGCRLSAVRRGASYIGRSTWRCRHGGGSRSAAAGAGR